MVVEGGDYTGTKVGFKLMHGKEGFKEF